MKSAARFFLIFLLQSIFGVVIAQPNLPTVTLTPVYSVQLPSELLETSGITRFQQGLVAHNDNSDEQLYVIDTLNGSILQTFTLNGTSNFDWEEITQETFGILAKNSPLKRTKWEGIKRNIDFLKGN